jgi:hypothetical protein
MRIHAAAAVAVLAAAVATAPARAEDGVPAARHAVDAMLQQLQAQPVTAEGVPAVAALRSNDPAAYLRFQRRYARAARGVTDGQLLTAMRTALRKSVKHLLANAPGDTLIDITQASLAYLQQLKASSPESCVAMSDDSKGAALTVNLANEFPVQFIRELEILERIAGTPSGTKIAPPELDDVQPHLDGVLRMLRRMNVQTRLQQLDTLDPSEFAPFCTMVIVFYAAVLDLPRDDAVKVLRWLYARAARTADRDLGKDGVDADDPAWRILRDTGTADQLRRFIAEAPEGPQRRAAEARLKALTEREDQGSSNPAPPPWDGNAARPPQKAVLYEESRINPAGEQFTGAAVWRIEPAPRAGSNSAASRVAIRADIDIPARNMTVRLTIYRNEDSTLPVSHTVGIRFWLPPDFPHAGIANVPGVLMKQGEAARGVALKGLAMKATDYDFLVSLSREADEMQHNVRLLRELPWLSIPIVYGDGQRAVIAIDKGEAGARAFAETFAAWERGEGP